MSNSLAEHFCGRSCENSGCDELHRTGTICLYVSINFTGGNQTRHSSTVVLTYADGIGTGAWRKLCVHIPSHIRAFMKHKTVYVFDKEGVRDPHLSYLSRFDSMKHRIDWEIEPTGSSRNRRSIILPRPGRAYPEQSANPMRDIWLLLHHCS